MGKVKVWIYVVIFLAGFLILNLQQGNAQEVEWRPDLTDIAIPDINAEGTIHGKEFTCEKAILKQGNILQLRQGEGFFADLELMIFLFPKENETIENNTFEITPESGFGGPHIHMKWKEEGGNAPKSKIFMKDYVMRLEFNAKLNGSLPGKIYICLPDEEKSVVAGRFVAEVK